MAQKDSYSSCAGKCLPDTNQPLRFLMMTAAATTTTTTATTPMMTPVFMSAPPFSVFCQLTEVSIQNKCLNAFCMVFAK